MSKNIPKIMVVYNTGECWRGFCVPYDVTSQASSMEEAKSRLASLVKLYEEGLKTHNYPEHLVHKELSDSGDKRFLQEVWPKIRKDIEKNKLDTYESYVQKQEGRHLSVKDAHVSYGEVMSLQMA